MSTKFFGRGKGHRYINTRILFCNLVRRFCLQTFFSQRSTEVLLARPSLLQEQLTFFRRGKCISKKTSFKNTPCSIFYPTECSALLHILSNLLPVKMSAIKMQVFRFIHLLFARRLGPKYWLARMLMSASIN